MNRQSVLLSCFIAGLGIALPVHGRIVESRPFYLGASCSYYMAGAWGSHFLAANGDGWTNITDNRNVLNFGINAGYNPLKFLNAQVSAGYVQEGYKLALGTGSDWSEIPGVPSTIVGGDAFTSLDLKTLQAMVQIKLQLPIWRLRFYVGSGIGVGFVFGAWQRSCQYQQYTDYSAGRVNRRLVTLSEGNLMRGLVVTDSAGNQKRTQYDDYYGRYPAKWPIVFGYEVRLEKLGLYTALEYVNGLNDMWKPTDTWMRLGGVMWTFGAHYYIDPQIFSRPK